MIEGTTLELAPIAPGQEELTVKQQNYAQLLANGYEYHDAWRRSAMGRYSKNKAVALARHPEVVAIITDVRDAAHKAQVMVMQEKRAFCAGVVRTPLGELSPESIFTKEFKKIPGKDGSPDSFEVKGLDKLKAIELDSKLAGDFDKTGESGGTVIAEWIARIREA